MQSQENALCRVGETEDGVNKNEYGAHGLKKRQRLEKKRRISGARLDLLSLEKLVRATETGRTGFSLENVYGGMLVELFRKKTLQYFAKCVRVCTSVKTEHVF